ncbi:hypothetical protein KIH74_12935 [Kineosporia sp. J2-2]|uniref:Uncharacterized protein n=1 Tax=Kineosporia corallincola TaxID=2835133 RepID=A0ABS5TFG3_9ACTN|nr:DUF6493 family protein [Kineosporia corallincola]MBT0769835.1 hypothetical protein [Kineosporia corallincola]
MSIQTETLFRHLTGHHIGSTAALLTRVSAEERETLAEQLSQHVRREGPEGRRSGSPLTSPLPAAAVAAVALMPSAAEAAALLTRPSLRPDWSHLPVERLVSTAARRGVSWLPDLAVRMAAEIRPGDLGQEWRSVARLVTACAATVPDDVRFVTGWVAWLLSPTRLWGWPSDENWQVVLMSQRLVDGPYLSALLPQLFRIPGLGVLLSSKGAALAPSLATLAATGQVDRAQLLDGCLDRLRQGDRPAALRFFTTLHDLLSPTDDERAARAGDYVALAENGDPRTARFGLRHLHGLLRSTRLDPELLLEHAPRFLARSENTVSRDSVHLLDLAACQNPAQARAFVGILIDHLAILPPTVQDQALDLVLVQARRLGPQVMDLLARSASALPPGLQERVHHERLGTRVTRSDLPTEPVTEQVAG